MQIQTERKPRTDSRENGTPVHIEGQALYEGARGAAIRILSRYERSDSYLDKLVEHELRTGDLTAQDKALLTEITNGVIRWMGKLDWVLTGFYHGEFDKCLTPVKNAMRIALYQIMFLSKIPHPVAINESVEVIKRIKGERAAGIVNGVLRNIVRHLDEIRFPNPADDKVWYLAVMYSHPRWLVNRWVDRFGEKEAELLLKANVARPVTNLRVNTLKANVDDLLAWLQETGVTATASPYVPSVIVTSSMRDIISSDQFESGQFSVQDASAALCGRLADPKPGEHVIDLCAAPGGKAFHAAELMQNTGSIIAVDKYDAKLRVIAEGAERLGLSIIETFPGDARTYTNDPADLVIADVPCSGLGTLTKKPDIKWKREPEEIIAMTALQQEILENAAKLVKVGGRIVYSTCSIEPEENRMVVDEFLANHPNFVLDDAAQYLPATVCTDGCMQTYPHTHGMDGAFAARLVRQS